MTRATPAVISAIVTRELPKGWKVREVRTVPRCRWDERTLDVPRLVDYRALWVFLHECGHANRMVAGTYKVSPEQAKRGEASANEEYMAEWHAINALRMYGFRVDRLVLAEAKRYVRGYIEKDDRAGWPVEPHVRKWAQETPLWQRLS